MAAKASIPLNVLVAAEAVHSFPQFLPDLPTLRREPENENVTDVRRGELYAASWSLVFALVVSHATDSTTPLLYWAATVGAMVLLYEYHMRDDGLSY